MKVKQAYVKTCRRNVATAGTREKFYDNNEEFYAVKSLTIRADATNTGNIYVGDSNRVSATDYSYILAPGETVTVKATELGPEYYIFPTQLWLDADTNGNALSFIAISDSEPW